MHCWLKRWQLVQRPSVEFSNPEQRIYTAHLVFSLQLSTQNVDASLNLPFVGDSNGRQWQFSVVVQQLDKPPGAPGPAALAHIDPDGIPRTGPAVAKPPSCSEVADIATSLEDTVEEGIAREVDNTRGHALGEEDRRPGDTSEGGQQKTQVSSNRVNGVRTG